MQHIEPQLPSFLDFQAATTAGKALCSVYFTESQVFCNSSTTWMEVIYAIIYNIYVWHPMLFGWSLLAGKILNISWRNLPQNSSYEWFRGILWRARSCAIPWRPCAVTGAQRTDVRFLLHSGKRGAGPGLLGGPLQTCEIISKYSKVGLERQTDLGIVTDCDSSLFVLGIKKHRKIWKGRFRT